MTERHCDSHTCGVGGFLRARITSQNVLPARRSTREGGYAGLKAGKCTICHAVHGMRRMYTCDILPLALSSSTFVEGILHSVLSYRQCCGRILKFNCSHVPAT